MTPKRKTPARRKSAPPESPLSAAPVSEAPGGKRKGSAAHAPVNAPEKVSAKAIESAPVASGQIAPPSLRVTHEERHRLIAKTAYGYAEKAGFRNNPVEDWLMAEREVEAKLQRLAS